jgi:hypothetical protein
VLLRGGLLPAPHSGFSFQLAGNSDLSTDPASGMTRLAAAWTILKRVVPDMGPIPVANAPGEKENQAQGRNEKKQR